MRRSDRFTFIEALSNVAGFISVLIGIGLMFLVSSVAGIDWLGPIAAVVFVLSATFAFQRHVNRRIARGELKRNDKGDLEEVVK